MISTNRHHPRHQELYDAHIPMVFMGRGIRHGATANTTHMTDIAPTIAALLHIQAPNGSIGLRLMWF